MRRLPATAGDGLTHLICVFRAIIRLSPLPTSAQTNKRIVELHLKIQIKSKEHFATHAGINALPASGGVDLSP
jgi:hypothetical protein